ncbi:MAG TPA: hypothetical protein VFQ45_13240 [Longimicrobium sp.]|nr:hypothetical protein [Longimicrobium sp.]
MRRIARPRIRASYSVPRTWYSALVFALLAASVPARAQAPQPSPEQWHDRIVAVMARAAGARALPAGDTTVTWSPNPVLYHVAGVTADSVSSGFLRADGMQGAATTRWTGGVLAAFRSRWFEGDSVREAAGEVADGMLRITGARDTALAIPSLPWAVADHGMEEHLAPLIAALPTESVRRIAILRPHAMKWDTLDVTVRRRGESLVATTRGPGGARAVLLIDAQRRLLWMRRYDEEIERQPLPGTPLYEHFRRMRGTAVNQP